MNPRLEDKRGDDQNGNCGDESIEEIGSFKVEGRRIMESRGRRNSVEWEQEHEVFGQ